MSDLSCDGEIRDRGSCGSDVAGTDVDERQSREAAGIGKKHFHECA